MKQFTFLELKTLELYTLGMRVCPDISFETANLINKNYLSVQRSLLNYGEKDELIKAREKANLESEIQNELVEEKEALNKEKFDTEIYQLESDSFKNIKGDCNLSISTKNLSIPYIEMYFYLLSNEIIK